MLKPEGTYTRIRQEINAELLDMRNFWTVTALSSCFIGWRARSTVVRSARWKSLIVVTRVKMNRQQELLLIVQAGGSLCAFLGDGQSGEKQRSQDRDDGDHHQ